MKVQQNETEKDTCWKRETREVCCTSCASAAKWWLFYLTLWPPSWAKAELLPVVNLLLPKNCIWILAESDTSRLSLSFPACTNANFFLFYCIVWSRFPLVQIHDFRHASAIFQISNVSNIAKKTRERSRKLEQKRVNAWLLSNWFHSITFEWSHIRASEARTNVVKRVSEYLSTYS